MSAGMSPLPAHRGSGRVPMLPCASESFCSIMPNANRKIPANARGNIPLIRCPPELPGNPATMRYHGA